MRPGHESIAKNTTRATRAHRGARMISLTRFLTFFARRLPHGPGGHHGDHASRRRTDIIIVGVVAISGAVTARAAVPFDIAVVGAILITVADVADITLSSRTSEHRWHAHVHHRRTQAIIGIDDTIIDAVIGRTGATRIMSFATQIAGGGRGMFARALEMTTSSSPK